MPEDFSACIREAEREDDAVLDAVFECEELNEADASQLEFRQVSFVNCTLEHCRFTRCSFYACSFTGCDLSGCDFTDSYWKQSRIDGCKGVQINFSRSRLKETDIQKAMLGYGNFSNSKWENCSITDSSFKESAFSEATLKKLRLCRVDFSGVDFFRTPLKDLDVSDCMIGGIFVSDSFYELKGLKIGAAQSMDLIHMLGVRIV